MLSKTSQEFADRMEAVKKTSDKALQNVAAIAERIRSREEQNNPNEARSSGYK